MKKLIQAAMFLVSLTGILPAFLHAQQEAESVPRQESVQVTQEDMVAMRGDVPGYRTVNVVRLDSSQITVIAKVFGVSPSAIERFRWAPSMAPASHPEAGTILYSVWHSSGEQQARVELRLEPSGATRSAHEPATQTQARKETESPVVPEASVEPVFQKPQAVVPAAARSNGAPLFEIGTYAGLSIMSPNDADADNVVSVGIPGGGLLGQSMVFASFFPRPKMAVEPQLNFSRVSSDGESVTVLGLEGRVAYLFAGAQTNSPYVSGHGALLRTSFDESQTRIGASASASAPAGSFRRFSS